MIETKLKFNSFDHYICFFEQINDVTNYNVLKKKKKMLCKRSLPIMHYTIRLSAADAAIAGV